MSEIKVMTCTGRERNNLTNFVKVWFSVVLDMFIFTKKRVNISLCFRDKKSLQTFWHLFILDLIFIKEI